MIPLIPFIFGVDLSSLSGEFVFSAIFTGIALFIVGAVKGFVTRKHWVRSALETLFVGGCAALLAFAVGYWIEGIVSN
jgi:VIT1/CCC1 family predicted Fe2+/Mn2+ transporter